MIDFKKENGLYRVNLQTDTRTAEHVRTTIFIRFHFYQGLPVLEKTTNLNSCVTQIDEVYKDKDNTLYTMKTVNYNDVNTKILSFEANVVFNNEKVAEEFYRENEFLCTPSLWSRGGYGIG